MLRYRLARIAVAAVVVTFIAAGVIAVVAGDARLSMLLLFGRFSEQSGELGTEHLVMLVLLGLLHGWGLWQILPGQGRTQGWDARWLRVALYVSAAMAIADRLIPADLPEDLVHAVVVVLFYRVMRGVSRKLRLIVLVAGLYHPVLMLSALALELAGLDGRTVWTTVVPLGGVPWLTWMVLTLVTQAKDGRWGRLTLWAGAVVAVGPFLSPSTMQWISNWWTWYQGVALALDVFTMVWYGRSAREVGDQPRQPRPARPKSTLRWPPVQVAAVVLPLLPAAVNGLNGVFFWIGPRGAIASWFSGTAWYLWHLWPAFDILVGIGGVAGLVLAAVRLRTRRLVLGTIWALLGVAVVGVVSRVTIDASAAGRTYDSDPEQVFDQIRIFPDQLLGPDVGISPLWYSAAFTASAFLLMLVYADPPARRRPYQIIAASTATGVLLVLMPVSDHAPGTITTSGECERRLTKARLTGEQAFVCGVRYSTDPLFDVDMPDRRVIAYGHRMCGVYTRGDASERAQFREAYGIDPLEHRNLLNSICPKADADLDKAFAEDEAEMLAREAEEQAKCDRAPRHRPLIKPVSAVRQERPIWTESALGTYEDDLFIDELPQQDIDLVAAVPGHLVIDVSTEHRVCVTTETYDRRPPVETKGWDHVVEVGYESPQGDLVLADNLGGTQLPNLAVRGKGHYRVRVHYACLSWKGEKMAGQRLLVMVWPGRGDKVTVHRARPKNVP